MSEKKLPRDSFIEEIYNEAKKNRNIYFLNADLGAETLDKFRVELKEQFIHVGISEQNMIDVAAGLAMEGKIVYVYAMAPFVTLRCFEQIKVALASMNLPVAIVGVGSGYSYAPAGPTHYATEDISCMRSLGNIEIFSPSDTLMAKKVAELTFKKPHLRYIRLDRAFLPPLYNENENFLEKGLSEIITGKNVCLITSGYMIDKALKVREILLKENIDLGIIDLFRVRPINVEMLKIYLQKYSKVVTLEEHFLAGGMGSAVCEAMSDYNIHLPVRRIGIKENYYLENGNREYLHKLAGIDIESLIIDIRKFALAK